MTDRKLPVKPVVTTTAPTSIMVYTAMSSAREKAHARPSTLSRGRTAVVSRKRKRTAMRGMALLVICDPLTMRIPQGLSTLIAPTRSKPVRTARREKAGGWGGNGGMD